MKLAEHRGIDTDVYGPAEDSALLAAAVEDDIDTVDLVLDVGTGTGYVGKRLAEATDARVIGTDINPAACHRARENGIEAVIADLTTPFGQRVFDVVVFNPPYLPEVPEMKLDRWFKSAVTGGESGRAVINSFIADVGRVIRTDGRVYLLISSLTGLDAVTERSTTEGFDVHVLERVEYPDEDLLVLRLSWNSG